LNFFYRELFWALLVVQSQVRKATQVVVEGACRFAVYGKTLG
jgi:hypothetical protein